MKNKYEELFDRWMNDTDFELVKYGNKFGVTDLDGANLGDIESDRFETAEQIIDRMNVYVNDYIISDLEEYFNDEIEYDDWSDLLEKVKGNVSEGYEIDVELLDLILNHVNEINLDNCKFIVD